MCFPLNGTRVAVDGWSPHVKTVHACTVCSSSDTTVEDCLFLRFHQNNIMFKHEGPECIMDGPTWSPCLNRTSIEHLVGTERYCHGFNYCVIAATALDYSRL